MKSHSTNLFALFFGSLLTQAGVLSVLHQTETIDPSLSATFGLALGAVSIAVSATLLGAALRSGDDSLVDAQPEGQHESDHVDQEAVGAP